MIGKIINYIQGDVFEDVKEINKINVLTCYLHMLLFTVSIIMAFYSTETSFSNIIISSLGHIFIILIVYSLSIYKQDNQSFQTIAMNTNITLSFFALYLWVNEFNLVNLTIISSVIFIILIINRRLIVSLSAILISLILSHVVIFIKGIDLTNPDFSETMLEFSFILMSFIVFVSMMNIFKSITFYIEAEKKENEEKQKKQDDLLYSILSTLENISMNYESDGTGFHNMRVQLYTVEIAKKLELEESFVEEIRVAAPLHDIGKIMIDQKVLTKETTLDSSERDYLESHVDKGIDIIKDLSLGSTIENIIKYHHERWDGLGYPFKLKGEDIPLEARILSVCDVYDALRSARAYKTPWTQEEAVNEIKNNSGTIFDPEVVKVFEEITDTFDKIFTENK